MLESKCKPLAKLGKQKDCRKVMIELCLSTSYETAN